VVVVVRLALVLVGAVVIIGLVLLTAVLWRIESTYRRRLPPDDWLGR
jgi:hypothetical protein